MALNPVRRRKRATEPSRRSDSRINDNVIVVTDCYDRMATCPRRGHLWRQAEPHIAEAAGYSETVHGAEVEVGGMV
jgi:hypothetical protein